VQSNDVTDVQQVPLTPYLLGIPPLGADSDSDADDALEGPDSAPGGCQPCAGTDIYGAERPLPTLDEEDVGADELPPCCSSCDGTGRRGLLRMSSSCACLL
jgi:hypothetical protein